MMIVAITHTTSRHTTTSIGTITATIIFELMFVIVAVLVTVGETALIPPAVVVLLLGAIVMVTDSVVTEVLTVVLVVVMVTAASVLDGFVVAVIVENIVEVDLSLSTLFMYCIVIVDDSSVGAADDTDGEGKVTFSQSQNMLGTKRLLKSQKQHWIGCSTVALIF